MAKYFSVVAVAVAETTWDEWKAQHGKVYNGDDEEETRHGIFNTNVSFIEAENAKDLGYTVGLNQLLI